MLTDVLPKILDRREGADKGVDKGRSHITSSLYVITYYVNDPLWVSLGVNKVMREDIDSW